MNNTSESKIKKLLSFIIFILIAGSVSYLSVYKLSFLPNGYDIISQQKESVIVKSFSFFGVEENTKTISFSENDLWKIDEMKEAVNRQKEFLTLLFFAVSVSTFLFISKLRKGVKLWTAIVGSNIIFAILLPILPIINSLNRIQYFIS